MPAKDQQPRAQPLLTEQQMRAKVLELVGAASARQTVRCEAAAGRIVAQDVASPVDLPCGPTSMMDGFAARFASLPATLPVVATAFAGAPVHALPDAPGCARIATGALVPAGLDCVIPVEQTEEMQAGVVLPQPARRGMHIRPAGSELRREQLIASQGTRLAARRIGLLLACGIDRVSVYQRPRIGVLSTGDELRAPGARLEPGSIVDASRPLLLALLARLGCLPVDLGIARDTHASLDEALDHAADSCDALITIGGASVGQKDLLRDVLGARGTLSAWKVAIKPGKPFILGQLGDKPVFGLPGNPGSSFVTFLLLVVPGLAKLAGARSCELARLQARLLGELPPAGDRATYLRGWLSKDDAQGWQVEPLADQGSGSLPALAFADCLIALPAGTTALPAGSMVDVVPLDQLD